MARHGSERSLNCLQSMHPGCSTHVNKTGDGDGDGDASPTELASPSVTCNDDIATKVNVGGSLASSTTGSETGTVPSPSVPSISSSSSADSRIPRPSPTGLRRSASMRMRGERVSPHQPPPPPSTAVTAALTRQHQHHRRFNFLQHQQHHHPDHHTFPVITENGTESPRQRSLALLKDARKEIEEKDQEIFRLTKEVVELRLYKASLNSPDERTDSSDALTVRENNPFSPESPSKDLPDEGAIPKVPCPETPEKRSQDLPSSLADSGHFEDGSIHSKDSVYLPEAQPEATNITITPNKVAEDDTSETSARSATPDKDEERRKLVNLYETRIEEMHRRHIDELQELKQRHNDKVESLLNQLAEVNTRYCEVRPSVDAAETRARELEIELEAVKSELAEQKSLLNEQEERNTQMYLKMYAKGQEAARIEQADQILEHAHQTPPKVSVAELLQQLTVTQAELENVKDTSYSPEPHISADRSQILLSAKEAVSLWVLGTRKVMYRRIIEARSQQGTLDPEITLQFLKSAIYYFLTDKENHQGHLNAIESILGFTEAEKHNIDRLYRSTRK
ncbi:GRIP domain-containing protein quick-to-court isoform X4 [Lasioglossum baleicum]|uniref:GRIP domain-containing protein quick-to-court isoform X4 n=1 Tax=Lasioglossum baleicum TaxID=434251 RepID=UPI003FCC4748